MQQLMNMAQSEILKLSEALLLCQRELAQVRDQQESLLEQHCSRLRVERDEAQAASAHLAQALADHLSRTFWEERQPTAPISWRRFAASRWSWTKRVLGRGRSAAGIAEDGKIRLIEASPLFQPAWYLQRNGDVVSAGINPATHYLHSGAREGRDPSLEFSTSNYFTRHPELEHSGINPLVHHLQSQSLEEPSLRSG